MRQRLRDATESKRITARLAIPALLVVAPGALFYGCLFSHLIDLPFYDDYSAQLGFLNQMVQAKGMAAKIVLLLAAQNNEYKLFFIHSLGWGQVVLLGHVNFVPLCVLGDSSVLVLAFLLWTIFLPEEKDLAKRLAFFIPAAWMLFQLGYWETLNWAMASLQNLWVIVFSLGTIQCLLRPTRKAYASGLLLYALAIGTSGNGLLLLPVGVLILATRRQLARVAGWLALSVVCIAAYAYRYNLMSSQAPSRGSVFSTLAHFRPDYSIAFIGNAAAIAGSSLISVWMCLTLGSVLLLFFGWLGWRGYVRRNAPVSYSVLFLLLTAVGVAGLRSDFGLMQSASSRYAIYGALLVILAWTAVTEEFLQHRSEPLLNNGPYLAMTMAAVLFALWMDEIGYLKLAGREADAVRWMEAFEHPGSPGSSEGPMAEYQQQSAATVASRLEARVILKESMQLGVYEPPKF